MLDVPEWVIILVILVILVIVVCIGLIIRKRIKQRKNITVEHKTDIQQIRDQINSVTLSMSTLPHSAEVNLITEKMSKIEQSFETLNENVIMEKMGLDSSLNSMKKEYIENLSTIEKKIFKETSEKILADATTHINETSVNKEEFDRLKSRIETLIGAEIDAKRLQYLNDIFGDTDRRDVLSWKCKVITHLKGGLAPKAEENILIQDQISITKATKFLKELMDMGVVEQKKIESYWLNDSFEWLHKYMGDVELLIHRIKQTVRNEKNYEKYIKENLNLIEDGLILDSEQYSFNDESIVDLVCMDKLGVKLFIELKYPTAKPTDKFQLVRYREAYTIKFPGINARFMIIAQSIPSVMQETLKTDNFEFKEILF